MAVPVSIHCAKGTWHGVSKLHLPWLALEKRISESKSTLHVVTDRQGNFATITYEWEYEGRQEQGTIILAKSSDMTSIQFGWVDSWHQSDSVLHLKGETSQSGSMKARGEYGAGDEVWGWTIELAPTSDSLALKMENVTPDGEATWAVDAVYSRV